MDKLSTYAPLIARIFIGLFFLLAGVGKVFDIAELMLEAIETK